jgi:integrase
MMTPHPLRDILPSSEDLKKMGRPRYQHPSVLKTKGNHARWYVRVMVDVLVDRNQTARREKPIYLGFCSEMGKREAEKLRDEKLKTVNNTPLVVQSQVLMKDLVQAYRAAFLPGLKPSTRHTYSHQIDRHILPAFGDLRLFEVDALKVQQWVYTLEKTGLARTSRANSVVVLRSIFEAAEEWGYFVGRNPCKKTKLGGGGEVWNKRALEPAEALRLLQEVSAEQPLGPIVEVALFTGLRVSEVLGLTWGAIDSRRALIEVRQARSQQGEFADPKTARGRRQVDLGPLTTKLVRPSSAKDADLIWPNEDYFSLQKKFRRRAKTAGIVFPGFGFHTLRRTYASWRDELGLATRPDENLVRDMGHSNTAMTEHYIQKTRTGIVERLQNLVFFSGVSRESASIS